MPRRGRPLSARAASARRVYLKLRLYPGEDDDLIAFFETIPSGLRAARVKGALRSGMETTTDDAWPPDETLLDALDDLVI